tara:strand:- start:307 stop:453 length:147 start_codon:yes stop_codon:yes gene_type:complete
MVWVEKGKLQPSGIPLLKCRRKRRRALAINLWKNLLSTGCRSLDAHRE